MAKRVWIGEIVARSVKTVLVTAETKKEANEMLKNVGGEGGDGVECIDVHYDEKSRRIVREDKPTRGRP